MATARGFSGSTRWDGAAWASRGGVAGFASGSVDFGNLVSVGHIASKLGTGRMGGDSDPGAGRAGDRQLGLLFPVPADAGAAGAARSR